MTEACAQQRYKSRVKMAGGRLTTPETGDLGVDGLIHRDLSGLYSRSHILYILLDFSAHT